MKRFRYIDHTGDLGVEVFGDTLGELFRNAGGAFADIVTDIRDIRRRETRKVALAADRLEDLLVRWFNEFIYYFDTEGLLFSVFEIVSIDQSHIAAKIHGEVYDDSRHRIKTTVKSATYHQLRVDREDGHWKAVVIFDL